LVSTQTANTVDTVTIDPGDASFVNLTTVGIIGNPSDGDTFEIIPCDTLSSFFGTPATTGIFGGSVPANADTVVVQNTFGNASTYYYNTSLNRWTRQALGNPDSSDVPIRPDTGIVYMRLGNTPLSLIITGSVPSTDRKALVKNSGVSYLSNSWPTDKTLDTFNFSSLTTWLSGSTPATADIVTIGSSNYYYDGANWRRQALGSPVSNPSIPAGSSVMINKKGNAVGAAILPQAIPYSIN